MFRSFRERFPDSCAVMENDDALPFIRDHCISCAALMIGDIPFPVIESFAVRLIKTEPVTDDLLLRFGDCKQVH